MVCIYRGYHIYIYVYILARTFYISNDADPIESPTMLVHEKQHISCELCLVAPKYLAKRFGASGEVEYKP